MENDDGESGDPSSKRGCGTPGACRVFFLPRKRHLRTVVVRSLPRFFQPSNPARKAETVWVSFWTLVLRKSFFLRRLHVRSHQDIPLQASRDTNVRSWTKEHPTR